MQRTLGVHDSEGNVRALSTVSASSPDTQACAPYGFVMPVPVGLSSRNGGVPLPYTVAEDENTMSRMPSALITQRRFSSPHMLFE